MLAAKVLANWVNEMEFFMRFPTFLLYLVYRLLNRTLL